MTYHVAFVSEIGCYLAKFQGIGRPFNIHNNRALETLFSMHISAFYKP